WSEALTARVFESPSQATLSISNQRRVIRGRSSPLCASRPTIVAELPLRSILPTAQAIVLPSGDQAGHMKNSGRARDASIRSSAPSALAVTIVVADTSFTFSVRRNARRFPSGEKVTALATEVAILADVPPSTGTR